MSDRTADVSDDRQVLVVGDGLSGLSAAAFLDRHGLDPTVVAGPNTGSTGLEAVGECVLLWHTGVALLGELGVTTELAPSAVEIDEWHLSADDGTVLERLETAHDESDPFLSVDRRRLRRALRDRLPANSVRETKTPRALRTDGGPPEVEFENGVRERFDLVVGADGTDSWVRAAGFDVHEPVPWQTTTWAFRADGAEVPGTVIEAWSADAIVTIVPRTAGACGRLVTTAHDAVTASDVLAETVDGSGGPVADALDRPGPDGLVGAPDHVLCTGRWVTGRLALLGDAARSFPPCSIGPSLAVEDAYVLAEELEARGTQSASLRRYEHRRWDRLRRLDHRIGAVGDSHRYLLPRGTLSDLQELRRSLLRASFARRPFGSTVTLRDRL